MSMIGYLMPLPPATLDALIADPDSTEGLVYPEDGHESASSIDLDKAWHGIHYLLTGTQWGGEPPLSLAVIGGVEIGPDVGYGPARYLTPAQVAAVAAALAPLTNADLAARYDPKDMDAKKIYPTGWASSSAESLKYLQHNFADLQALYVEAARRADGVLQWLS